MMRNSWMSDQNWASNQFVPSSSSVFVLLGPVIGFIEILWNVLETLWANINLYLNQTGILSFGRQKNIKSLFKVGWKKYWKFSTNKITRLPHCVKISWRSFSHTYLIYLYILHFNMWNFSNTNLISHAHQVTWFKLVNRISSIFLFHKFIFQYSKMSSEKYMFYSLRKEGNQVSGSVMGTTCWIARRIFIEQLPPRFMHSIHNCSSARSKA